MEWKKENNATDEEVCERHEYTVFNDVNARNETGFPTCGVNCKCCKIEGSKFTNFFKFRSGQLNLSLHT